MAARSEQKQDVKQVFQRVKSATSLQAVIEYMSGVTARRVGSSLFFNPSPCCAHNDCFALFGDDLSAYKCHSCGEGGDVFSFVQAREGVTAGEARRLVAAFAGVALPQLGRDDDISAQADQKALRAKPHLPP